MVSNFEQPPESKKNVTRSDAPLPSAEQRRRQERWDLADAVYHRMKQLNPRLREFDDDTFRQARNEVFATRHVGSPGTKEERQAAFTRMTRSVKSRVIKLFHRDHQITLGLTDPTAKMAWMVAHARSLQGNEQRRAGQTYKESGLVAENDIDVYTSESDDSDNEE